MCIRCGNNPVAQYSSYYCVECSRTIKNINIEKKRHNPLIIANRGLCYRCKVNRREVYNGRVRSYCRDCINKYVRKRNKKPKKPCADCHMNKRSGKGSYCTECNMKHQYKNMHGRYTAEVNKFTVNPLVRKALIENGEYLDEEFNRRFGNTMSSLDKLEKLEREIRSVKEEIKRENKTFTKEQVVALRESIQKSMNELGNQMNEVASQTKAAFALILEETARTSKSTVYKYTPKRAKKEEIAKWNEKVKLAIKRTGVMSLTEITDFTVTNKPCTHSRLKKLEDNGELEKYNATDDLLSTYLDDIRRIKSSRDVFYRVVR